MILTVVRLVEYLMFRLSVDTRFKSNYLYWSSISGSEKSVWTPGLIPTVVILFEFLRFIISV